MGVGILGTKGHKPLNVLLGALPPAACHAAEAAAVAAEEGRVVTVEYASFYLVVVYTPNSGDKLQRLDWRTGTWDVAMREAIVRLQARGAALEFPPPWPSFSFASAPDVYIRPGFSSSSRRGPQKVKDVVIMGDLNVGVEDVDIWNAKASHVRKRERETSASAKHIPGRLRLVFPSRSFPLLSLLSPRFPGRASPQIKKTPGLTPVERASFRTFLAETGMADSFRAVHGQATGVYTYWSTRANNRPSNHGLRIDYGLVSARMVGGAAAGGIKGGAGGGARLHDAFVCDGEDDTGFVRQGEVKHVSDHCPVGITLLL